MVSPFVAFIRLIVFVLWTLVSLIVYLPIWALRVKAQSALVRGYFQGVALICGFKPVLRGVPESAAKPVLFVANHASYLDIIVLGSVLRACFVAKAEVAGWPVFGFLSKVARTVFVDRRRGAAARERDQLRGRLETGESLILFPEGTSNDGNRVLPFKSSFLAVAEPPLADGRFIQVQPVTLAYTRLDGLPMGRAMRPFYAWYGDMTLADHLFACLGLGDVTVEVILHPPVSITDFRDRKALTSHCHDVVSGALVQALAGRLNEERLAAHRPVPVHPPQPIPVPET